jgi:hypothetical protein
VAKGKDVGERRKTTTEAAERGDEVAAFLGLEEITPVFNPTINLPGQVQKFAFSDAHPDAKPLIDATPLIDHAIGALPDAPEDESDRDDDPDLRKTRSRLRTQITGSVGPTRFVQVVGPSQNPLQSPCNREKDRGALGKRITGRRRGRLSPPQTGAPPRFRSWAAIASAHRRSRQDAIALSITTAILFPANRSPV